MLVLGKLWVILLAMALALSLAADKKPATKILNVMGYGGVALWIVWAIRELG